MHCQFRYYLLLFEDEICPLSKRLASHNSIQKEDDKAGNITAYNNASSKNNFCGFTSVFPFLPYCYSSKTTKTTSVGMIATAESKLPS